MSSDEACMDGLLEYVNSQAKFDADTPISELLYMLENFEKAGIKKTPERLQVLKELKDRIDGDTCKLDDLLDIAEAYPKRLKNKVSL
mmetsp:Transcript_20935/g.25735  ORF Transcript_20935/g.25735 Transcript_20935/m.25735 type:complete len:87 (+) Transcript_20935:1179-1439(+)|eukprot:CAMPEP_0170451134 /NCGR_PEP_ID=MMETSP0123-20130129/474_1 /TAXON_ID=182087 /ORGANISM="Favella ehrenbergii, Strain Fehren 1" /LENGTH=86 /DNA_ID=CAMNT_0010712719 /DNA_START=1408 /DNA_END=1668 /DNA_ORIENTATION=+